MRHILLTLIILVGLSGSALSETIKTTVKGMVCAFCATGIEKTFRKQPEVATVKVDLPTKLVTITTKPAKTLSD
jgi:copper chaperone CopZ